VRGRQTLEEGPVDSGNRGVGPFRKKCVHKACIEAWEKGTHHETFSRLGVRKGNVSKKNEKNQGWRGLRQRPKKKEEEVRESCRNETPLDNLC